MKKAAIVVSLAVVFSIVTQRSSKWKPIKTLHLTKESFQNKNTSAQSRLGEHGPLKEVFVFVSSQSVRLPVSLSPNVIYNISMTVLDFGFYSMDSGFQVLDSLFFVSGTWILDS